MAVLDFQKWAVACDDGSCAAQSKKFDTGSEAVGWALVNGWVIHRGGWTDCPDHASRCDDARKGVACPCNHLEVARAD